ncbi:hypothetical protein HYR99_26370 [Candidatus Poribacteria bacterium]|nr:hypothetical protein [Candidatus Poribacteria bacterium]
MAKKAISMSLILFLLMVVNAGAAPLQVGFVVLGDEGPFTKPAAEFAKKAFNTTRLARKDLKSGTFQQFAVVWWHEGDSDPGALTKPEIDAFMDYAKAGGAVLLTGWAIRYATPMGLEKAEARQFGPVAADGINVGITVTKETERLGLLKGLKNLKGEVPKVGDRVQVNLTGYPKSGDYFDKIWKDFITLAEAWGPPANDWGDRIAAFGYWNAGKGKVFNMNWRLPNFHANNKDIDQLSQLTENVINWLGSESAFAAVTPADKLPLTWGALKSRL